MLQYYINHINHNRYLKIQFNNIYKYSKLNNLIIYIKFKKNISSKFSILCCFFLFKDLVKKNSYIIILKKKNKQILGLKLILKYNLMFKFLNLLILKVLNKPEIQNNIKLISFDKNNNYILNLVESSYYYFEKFIKNEYYCSILNDFNIYLYFNFIQNDNKYDHIFFLNMFKFYYI